MPKIQNSFWSSESEESVEQIKISHGRRSTFGNCEYCGVIFRFDFCIKNRSEFLPH